MLFEKLKIGILSCNSKSKIYINSLYIRRISVFDHITLFLIKYSLQTAFEMQLFSFQKMFKVEQKCCCLSVSRFCNMCTTFEFDHLVQMNFENWIKSAVIGKR